MTTTTTSTLLVVLLFWKVCTHAYPTRSSISSGAFVPYPGDEEQYVRMRDEMKKLERTFENRLFNLTQEETVADRYLAYLKWREFERTRDTGLPASLPIEHNLVSIQASEVYKALWKMPKGGNLHSHEDHQLSRRTLLEIVWASDDFKHFWIVDPSSNHTDAWKMDFFINPPIDTPWRKVESLQLKIDEILKHNTLINLLTPEAYNSPTLSSLRWSLINPLWARLCSQLTSNVNIKRPYLKALMRQSVTEGVIYLESRRSFGVDLPLYELDDSGASSATNGKKFIDEGYEKEVTLAMEVEEEMKAELPDFIGFKRISYAVRSAGDQLFNAVMNTTLHLHRKYPQHVVGFDVVADENGGPSNLHFVDEFTRLSDGKGSTQLPLFLHTAETSWPDDLMTSQAPDDLVATLENSYEGLLLKTKRVGHGKGFLKRPYLRKLLKLTSTAVEVCPLSNQILGMEPDLRNHFGQTYHREGVPIVLAPDDPGTFGFDNFTLDWYAVFTGWGLELGDLKQIARNSLIYTAMTEEEKKRALEVWNGMWERYVKGLEKEACGRDFAAEATSEGRSASFKRALPSYGSAGTKIHIYGSRLEVGVCRGVVCRVGEDTTPFQGTYVSYKELVCKVPDLGSTQEDLKIYVSFGGISGAFVDTGLSFKYQPEAAHDTSTNELM